MNLHTLDGNEAFYFRNIDGQLLGAVITHVDDFNMANTDEFLEEVISLVEKELNVSTIEKDVIRFTGLDIKVVDDGIEVSMDDYADSLKDIKEIRKTEDRNELLTKLEIKE